MIDGLAGLVGLVVLIGLVALVELGRLYRGAGREDKNQRLLRAQLHKKNNYECALKLLQVIPYIAESEIAGTRNNGMGL